MRRRAALDRDCRGRPTWLAGQGLEFGLGTGRVALPLHRSVVCISGVGASAEMVA